MTDTPERPESEPTTDDEATPPSGTRQVPPAVYPQPGPPPGYGGPPPGYGPSPGYGPPPGYGPQYWAPPAPGVIPLRPLGLGEIFGGAVGYIRANPIATVGTAALGFAIVALVQFVAQLVVRPRSGRLTASEFGTFVGSSFGASGVAAVVSLVVGAALTGVLLTVLRGALVGRRSSMGDALRSSAPRIPGLIGISLLLGLIVVVIMLVGIGIAIGIGVATQGSGGGIAVAVLLGLATLVLATYVAVTFCLATSAYVVEDIGAVASLSRSRALVRGTWWRIFGILLLTGLIYGVIVRW